MTMEIELAKRDFVKQLWDETQGDEAARDLVFGDVIDAMKAHMEEVAAQRKDAIRGELSEDVKDDLVDDPPDDLRAKVIKSLIEYPPNGSDMDSWPQWLELKRQLKEEIHDALDNELGDLRLANEVLQEEIARLKGEKYEPPEVRNAKRGKVRR